MCSFTTKIAIVILCSLLLIGCGSSYRPVPPFSIANELVVITVVHADNFYIDADNGFSGIAYDLAHEFAVDNGLEIRFIAMPNVASALTALQQHRAHLGIGLNIQENQNKRYVLGPVYLHNHHQLAFNAKYKRPMNIQQLAGKRIEVPVGSMHEELLQKIKSGVPELEWSAVILSSEALLRKVNLGEIDYTVAHSRQIKKAHHFYPQIKGAFELGTSASRWVFPKYSEKILIDKVSSFFERMDQEGVLGQLLDNYNGQYQQLSPGDIFFFKKKVNSRLPDLKHYFLQAGRLTDLDWRLLAALAYQESHWNSEAKSPTGVRGIMMLTRETESRMGVKNPVNIRQNIIAGARYLRMLIDELPEDIQEPDRIWIALAAYNQGYGRIIDARELATRFNLNPNIWIDLKKMLPLLSRKHYTDTLKYGRARGDEAVVLTNAVRAYYEILKNIADTES